MTERLWIFPAIFCLLLSMTFYEPISVFGGLLAIIWFVRILCLKHPPIIKITIVISLLFMGTISFHQYNNKTHLTDVDTHWIVYPKATSIQVDGDSIRFEGVVQGNQTEEGIVVTYYAQTEEEKNEWLKEPPLSHLLIEGELNMPAGQSNFHQFDYRKYLKRENIHWQLKADTISVVEDGRFEKPRMAWLETIRHRIFQYIDGNFHPKIASYLKILFFADNRTFSEDALQNYRSLGLVHLFSISGFHISYLVNLIRRFLLRVGITHNRTNLMLFFILPVYGCLAGFGVSVFRAVFQNMWILVSRLLNRPMDTIDAWALTMMMALFIQPAQIYHISFQLSYTLSGLFILIGKQKWTHTLSPINYSVLFSLMSGLASLPILTYHFYEFAWVSTFANLFFIPFFSNVFFPVLLFLFLGSFLLKDGIILDLLEQLMLLFIQFLEQFLAVLTDTFDFSFVTGRLPFIILLLLISNIFFVLIKVENKRRPNVLILACIGLCLCYHQITPAGFVVMLDVGQGDAILIKEPITGHITLIDTGGQVQWGEKEVWRKRQTPFSIGEDVVVPSLKSLGISAIDRLYLSHADADHSGEIASIANGLTIKEIAATTNTFKDPSVFQQIRTLKQTDLIVVHPPEVLAYPVAQTIALHPKADAFYKDNNNPSLVLYVTLGEDKWLFTGDIEEEAEKQLIEDYPHLPVDYLKVSHHGSKTSSTEAFIQHVQPKEALISVGETNTFGHPHPDVMERFKTNQIKVHATSEDGAIMYRYVKLPFIDYWLQDFKTVHKN